MSEEDIAVVGKYVEEVWHQGKLDKFEEYIAKDIVPHGNGGPADAEGMKESIRFFRSVFTNLKLEFDDVMAVDDKVIARWTASGRHKGEIFGVPGTGKDVAWSGITIFRLAGGKIAEFWLHSDNLGLMQQIGAIPS